MVQELHERENVDAVVMLDQDLPSYLLAKVQAMFSSDVDVLNLLEMAREAIETELGRRLHIWPPEFWTSNLLSMIHNLHRLMESLPKDLFLLLVAFQENKIWSSLIIQIQGGQLKRITTTKSLHPLDRPITDWREDYKLLLNKMKEQIGRPTIGFFIDDEALRFLFRSSQPIDFIRQARRTGQIILDPLPSQLKRRL